MANVRGLAHAGGVLLADQLDPLHAHVTVVVPPPVGGVGVDGFDGLEGVVGLVGVLPPPPQAQATTSAIPLVTMGSRRDRRMARV
jgi:hypothetical protein